MRTPLIAGNWKMNKTVPESLELIRAIREKVGAGCSSEVVVIPPFTSLFSVQEALRGSDLKLGAQNLSQSPQGALTGEVSGAMLISAGCQYVIVGHSERRQMFREDNALVHQKMRTAFSEGLHPILCVGETWEERQAGRTREIIGCQLKEALDGVTEMEIRKTVVAYEPVWAIGTGKNAEPGQAQEIHEFIRSQIGTLFNPEIAQRLRIIYGGSVNPANSENLLSEADIDGALVGGASLDADSFCAIINSVK